MIKIISETQLKCLQLSRTCWIHNEKAMVTIVSVCDVLRCSVCSGKVPMLPVVFLVSVGNNNVELVFCGALVVFLAAFMIYS